MLLDRLGVVDGPAVALEPLGTRVVERSEQESVEVSEGPRIRRRANAPLCRGVDALISAPTAVRAAAAATPRSAARIALPVKDAR
jgi:hypothetical protein